MQQMEGDIPNFIWAFMMGGREQPFRTHADAHDDHSATNEHQFEAAQYIILVKDTFTREITLIPAPTYQFATPSQTSNEANVQQPEGPNDFQNDASRPTTMMTAFVRNDLESAPRSNEIPRFFVTLSHVNDNLPRSLGINDLYGMFEIFDAQGIDFSSLLAGATYRNAANSINFQIGRLCDVGITRNHLNLPALMFRRTPSCPKPIAASILDVPVGTPEQYASTENYYESIPLGLPEVHERCTNPTEIMDIEEMELSTGAEDIHDGTNIIKNDSSQQINPNDRETEDEPEMGHISLSAAATSFPSEIWVTPFTAEPEIEISEQETMPYYVNINQDHDYYEAATAVCEVEEGSGAKELLVFYDEENIGAEVDVLAFENLEDLSTDIPLQDSCIEGNSTDIPLQDSCIEGNEPHIETQSVSHQLEDLHGDFLSPEIFELNQNIEEAKHRMSNETSGSLEDVGLKPAEDEPEQLQFAPTQPFFTADDFETFQPTSTQPMDLRVGNSDIQVCPEQSGEQSECDYTVTEDDFATFQPISTQPMDLRVGNSDIQVCPGQSGKQSECDYTVTEKATCQGPLPDQTVPGSGLAECLQHQTDAEGEEEFYVPVATKIRDVEDSCPSPAKTGSSRWRPLRIGLSRKQRVTALHQAMNTE